jgi:B12 binding domain
MKNCCRVALVVCPLGSRWVVQVALPSVAAFVEMYDYEVKCWDLNLEFQDSLQGSRLYRTFLEVRKWYWAENDPQIESILEELVGSWAEMILRDGTTVVGLSISLVTVQASLLLAKAIKKLDSNVVTVIGGPECMYSWPQLIKEDAIDFVILGEGERPFLELLQALDRGQKQVNNSAVVTKETYNLPHMAAMNADLDRLPYPDFSKVELVRYADRGVVDLPIFGSVGCIRNCTFCSRRFLNGTYRYKSPHRIISELERGIELYSTTSFFFVDSL